MERVEDVDEDQEDGRQEGHPGGDDVGRNQETRLSEVQKTLSSLVYKELTNLLHWQYRRSIEKGLATQKQVETLQQL